MKRHPRLRRLGRAAGAALLFLAPLRLAAPLDAHPGHAGGGGTPVFSEARHAGHANHWEAAEAPRVVRCGACLAPSQLVGPAPAATAAQVYGGAGRPLSRGLIAPRESDAGRPGRPRAPPPSASP